MRTSARIAIILTLVGTATTGQAETYALGRLFFTPEERSAIDRQRIRVSAPGTPVHTGNLTINGTVKRSNGQSTTWINGTRTDDTRADRSDLRVGSSINPANGEKDDLLRGGSIMIKPSPPRSPSP